MNILGWLLFIAGAAMIGALIVIGVDLTGGQLLVQYGGYWVIAVALVFRGATIINRTEGR